MEAGGDYSINIISNDFIVFVKKLSGTHSDSDWQE
jgi:hypothetical protein